MTVSRGSGSGTEAPGRCLALPQPFCRDLPPQQSGTSSLAVSAKDIGVHTPQETQKLLFPSLSLLELS